MDLPLQDLIFSKPASPTTTQLHGIPNLAYQHSVSPKGRMLTWGDLTPKVFWLDWHQQHSRIHCFGPTFSFILFQLYHLSLSPFLSICSQFCQESVDLEGFKIKLWICESPPSWKIFPGCHTQLLLLHLVLRPDSKAWLSKGAQCTIGPAELGRSRLAERGQVMPASQASVSKQSRWSAAYTWSCSFQVCSLTLKLLWERETEKGEKLVKERIWL